MNNMQDLENSSQRPTDEKTSFKPGDHGEIYEDNHREQKVRTMDSKKSPKKNRDYER